MKVIAYIHIYLQIPKALKIVEKQVEVITPLIAAETKEK